MSLMQMFPSAHKETVTVVRRSAYERDGEKTIATNVLCMLVPRTDAAQRRDAVDVRSGVPIYQSEWTALLEKPNPNIAKGDFLICPDGSELRVEAAPKIANDMQLILREQGVL